MRSLKFDSFLLSRVGRTFALRVSGESMIDRILDRDFVFVLKQHEVTYGEASVVMADAETTARRLFCEGAPIRLQPANEIMEPIYLSAADVAAVDVFGAPVGVYRKLHLHLPHSQRNSAVSSRSTCSRR